MTPDPLLLDSHLRQPSFLHFLPSPIASRRDNRRSPVPSRLSSPECPVLLPKPTFHLYFGSELILALFWHFKFSCPSAGLEVGGVQGIVCVYHVEFFHKAMAFGGRDGAGESILNQEPLFPGSKKPPKFFS